MNTEELKHKRQLNVQEQNALDKQRILEAARSFQTNSEFVRWVQDVLDASGLEANSGILASSSAVPCGSGEQSAKAIWVTNDGRFFSIEAIIGIEDHSLIELETIRDVTQNTRVSAHTLGRGKTFGCLSLEVLRELTGNG